MCLAKTLIFQPFGLLENPKSSLHAVYAFLLNRMKPPARTFRTIGRMGGVVGICLAEGDRDGLKTNNERAKYVVSSI